GAGAGGGAPHQRHARRRRLPPSPGGSAGQTGPAHRRRAGQREPNVSKKILVHTQVNGKNADFLCEPRQSLLQALRDELRLTGTREGCNNGNCGACNVLLDGRLINSCLVMAAEVEGRSVTTVEGLATPQGLHPLQQKFLEHAALQCGICTPGFLIAAKALLERRPKPTEHEVRHWLAGNLCRCTGYDKIVRAVLDAAEGAAP